YCSHQENEPQLGTHTALPSLPNGRGNSGGKSRLFVALCRNRGVPARLVSGLVLHGDQEQGLHHWAEAWAGDQWLPACPTYGHFGTGQFPKNYLVLQIGDEDLVRGNGVSSQFGFLVKAGAAPTVSEEETATDSARRSWHAVS